MPLNLNGLSKNNYPKLIKENNEKYYIPSEEPPQFFLKKKLLEGGNNMTFIVKVNGKKYLFRESLCKYSKSTEWDFFIEFSLSIKMSILNISPKMYGYGFSKKKNCYWSLHELFDCNLAQLVKKYSNCESLMKKVESQLIKLFKALNKTSFCYDIHPRNVVVKRQNKTFILKLIDFDAKYCTKKRPTVLNSKEAVCNMYCFFEQL